MTSTRFTELVGCTFPIQQAGMGAVAPPQLTAAVSEAGGLGMVGTARPGVTTDTLTELLDSIRRLTNRAYGVNFIVSPLHLNGGPGANLSTSSSSRWLRARPRSSNSSTVSPAAHWWTWCTRGVLWPV